MIVLIGFMGSGKTTVGRLLAQRVDLRFIDSDQLIEQRLGRSIRSVFDEDGEAHFREIEHTTVTELMRGERAVVALGGGAVQDARTRAVLGSGGPDARVVYLQVDYDEALARVGRDESRPMLHRTGLAELYERRLPAYRELAVVTVATGGRSADAVVTEVLHRLGEDPHRP